MSSNPLLEAMKKRQASLEKKVEIKTKNVIQTNTIKTKKKPKTTQKSRKSTKQIVKEILEAEKESISKEFNEQLNILDSRLSVIKEQNAQLVMQIKMAQKENTMKSPSELFDTLLKKYKIPISTPYDKLRRDAKNINNKDEAVFIVRYAKNRKDFDLYYGLVS